MNKDDCVLLNVYLPILSTMIFNFLRLNLLFILVLGTSTTLVFSFANNVTDEHALLSFKNSITNDPSGVLHSWNSSVHFCQWTGVKCSLRRQRVTVLDLPSLNLVGTLSPHIGNLSFLRTIYLYKNNFHGSIPNEIGRLFRLQRLSLGNNSFQGGFPANLHHCTDMRFISLYKNHLGGELPTEVASWSKLELFSLANNHFNGPIPPSIGNISSLRSLYLGGNNLRGSIPNEIGRLIHLQYLNLKSNSFKGVFPTNLSHCVDIRNISMYANDLQGELPTDFSSWSKLEILILGNNHFTGSIPPSIGNVSSLRILQLGYNNLVGGIPFDVSHLEKLEFLDLTSNSLSGMVPLQLYNNSFLRVVGLADNELEGTLPTDLGFTLPKLQVFYVDLNRFSGPLPPSIVNASNLVMLDISINNITGPIPNNLGSLPNLEKLSLGQNPLGENMRPDDLSFVSSLVNCTHLKELALEESSLRGELPCSFVNLSTTMERLHLYENHIYGSIPREIGKLVNMRVIELYGNLLTGTIPESIGEPSNLGVLDLSDNNISGVIPISISNLTQLVFLNLKNNMFQGSIPTQLFNISTLEHLFLANNRLSGIIPDEIVFFTQCFELSLARNLFYGTLPSNIGSLKQLILLDVSYNKFTGDIPTTLGGCVMLGELRMEGNFFQGTIPSSFKALKSLRILDLSRNNISENIPRFFGDFHLIEYMNLSHNKFRGEVPTEGLFSNVSTFSVVENSELCGGIQALHLPACPVKHSKNKKKAFSLRIIVILVLVPLGIFLTCLALICYRRRNSKKLIDPVPVFKDNQNLKLSYRDLLQATNEFSPINLLGAGRYGSVYKGVLESQELVVAVKVLNVAVRGASKSFLAECEMLRNVRHRNLIKIITACSTTDFKGNDFKALVFEFMTNGSVDDWLHPSPKYQGIERNLSLLQRLNISIDVALGVDYLHHHTHASIIHCDLKPSNILLDENFVARIGDFGLARFCFAAITSDINQDQLSSTGVRGTVGYVPPEYGMCAEISTEGDVYSYGILLLELFSGKRPTEGSISMDCGNNLHDYVRQALPRSVMDIVDPWIVLVQEECGSDINQSYSRDTMEVCLASIFEVGILCSEETPKNRLDISVAIKQLNMARDKLLQCIQ